MLQPMKDMLVDSIACGDESLRNLLAENVDIISCMHDGCGDVSLAYLRSQLGLIQLAQDYSRNQIDIATTRANSAGADVYDQTSSRDSTSERVTSAQNCAWSRATSFQQFQRDSESHDRNEAKSTSTSEGRSWDLGSDRSQQHSNGFATSFSQATSNTDGSGSGVSHAHSERNSRSSSGTGPLLAGDPNPATATGYTIVPPFISTSGGAVASPEVILDPCPDEPNEPCPPISSYGRGVMTQYNYAIGIPTIGVMRADWAEGESFQRSFVCSGGSTSMDSTSYSTQDYAQTDTAQNTASSESHDSSSNQKNVHRQGEKHDSASSHATAGASGVSASRGESHTGSDRSSHRESESTGSGSARSKSQMRGDGSGYNDSQSVSTARYWSQIFDSLAEMWRRVFEEEQDATRIIFKVAQRPAAGKMATAAVAMQCAQRGNIVFQQLNRPCPTIRGLPRRGQLR